MIEKVKNLLRSVGLKNLLIGCLAVAVIMLGWLSWRSPKPVDTQGLLAELEQKLTEKHNLEMQERDAKITELTNRVTISDAKYKVLQKKLTEVKNETIVPPKSNKELRDRFTALGFAPK